MVAITEPLVASLLAVCGTLLAVIVGHLLVTQSAQRARRELMSDRWFPIEVQAYADYLAAVVVMARTAGRVAACRGWDPLAFEAGNVDDLLKELDEAEVTRTSAFEMLYLVATPEVSTAATLLNETVWEMEHLVDEHRGVPGNLEMWRHQVGRYTRALDEFHLVARDALKVGHAAMRTADRVVYAPPTSEVV